VQRFEIADHVVAAPPSLAPTLLQMDVRGALTEAMAPIVAIFLVMVFFDTVGTLVGVAQQAGLMRDDRLPRARQAFLSDAVGTVAGAALGTSTVTSYLESATDVLVGGMMLVNVRDLEWDDYTEVVPGFLVLLGIPSSYSIADGLALGFISYPLVKVLGGRGRDLRWVSWLLAVLLLGDFVLVRSRL
jgi:AGZA family xanthine/uracil permease-like MFS transporter